MRTATSWVALSLATVLLAAAPAFASVQPRTTNGITFLTGGVGDEEEREMQAMQGQYPLRLLFAVKGRGNYLADVDVTIRDRQGRTVLATTSDGPFLYADVPPGAYRVTAVSAGREMTQSVTVPQRGAVQERFYWPPLR